MPGNQVQGGEIVFPFGHSTDSFHNSDLSEDNAKIAQCKALKIERRKGGVLSYSRVVIKWDLSVNREGWGKGAALAFSSIKSPGKGMEKKIIRWAGKSA